MRVTGIIHSIETGRGSADNASPDPDQNPYAGRIQALSHCITYQQPDSRSMTVLA
jgi:hypothetical protein